MTSNDEELTLNQRASAMLRVVIAAVAAVVLCSHFLTGILIRWQPFVAYARDGLGGIVLIFLFILNLRRWDRVIAFGLLIPLFYISYFLPLAFDTNLQLAALVTLKWPVMWLTAFFLGITVQDIPRFRTIVTPIVLTLLVFFVIDGAFGVREARQNRYFYEGTNSDLTATGVQVSKQLALEGQIRPRATQRDTFFFSNEMASAALVCLCIIPVVPQLILRAGLVILSLFFTYATFISCGRTGLIGLFAGGGFFLASLITGRYISFLRVPILFLALACFCVHYIGVGRATTYISQTLFSSTVVGNDESAHMRDELWRESLRYREKSDVSKYLGWPVATMMGDPLPPAIRNTGFITDNAFLYTLLTFGVLGVIIHFGTFTIFLFNLIKFLPSPVTTSLVTFLVFPLAEGLGRDSQFFYGSLFSCFFIGLCSIRRSRDSVMERG
jgi:hypothetical protein